MEGLQFQVNVCHVSATEEKLQMLGTSSGLLTWRGSYCISIQVSNSELAISKAIEILQSLPIVDNQLVDIACLPYHQSLELSLDPGILSDKIPCRICGEEISNKGMRKHVGIHIIKGDLGLVCAFCGIEGCSVELVKSGRGKTATLIPGSNCEYFSKFSIKSSEKSTKSGPCTNRPVSCSVCKTVQWSYNLSAHFRIKHRDYPIPTNISEEERKFMGIH